MKNLNKWKFVVLVLYFIGFVDKLIFCVFKIFCEVDDVYCFKEFVVKWGKIIKDVIDIFKD